MNKTEEQMFEEEFTHMGIFGERRLSMIRLSKTKLSDGVSLDDQIIEDIKAFLSASNQRVAQALLEECLKALPKTKAGNTGVIIAYNSALGRSHNAILSLTNLIK